MLIFIAVNDYFKLFFFICPEDVYFTCSILISLLSGVFVFASKSETQGMVLTEAMAVGVPVVALDALGVRELVDDGVNGRLLRDESVAAFVEALQWLAHPECRFPALLCGDFNATPGSPVCRLLQSHLVDAQLRRLQKRPMKTFCSRYPLARIDHVYASPGIELIDFEVPVNELAQVASDHLPLVVTFRLQ